MRRPLIPLLLAVLGVAILAGVWGFGADRRPHSAPVGGPAPASTSEAPAPPAVVEPTAPDTADRAPARDPERRAVEELPAPAPGLTDDELEDAVWVEGRVVFPAGTPADEVAEVVAVGRAAYHRARVQPDGTFRVAFVPQGTRVQFWLEARYLRLPEPVRHRLAALPDDLVLEPELGARLVGRVALPPGASASGLAGRPVVIEHHPDSGGPGSSPGRYVATAHLDEELAFEANALLAPRTLAATFVVEGWPNPHTSIVELVPGATVRVAPALVRGVNVAGVVADTHGEPFARAWVEVVVSEAGETTWTETVRAGAEGEFATTVLPGTIRVEVRARHFPTVSEELGPLAGGEDRTDLALVLGAGREVRGSVVQADGRPAVGARVDLLDRDGHSALLLGKLVHADEEGAFVLAVTDSEGPYTVSAHAAVEDDAPFGTTPRAWASAGGVALGDEVRLVLAEGTRLRGRTVDDRGTPLDRFTVRFHQRVHRDTLPTLDPDRVPSVDGRDGAFEILGLPPGRYWLWAEQESAVSQLVPVSTESSDVPPLRVPRTGTIRGQVVGPDGPVARARVRAELDHPEDAPPAYRPRSRRVRTRRDGTFELRGVPAGEVRVLAGHKDLTHADPPALVLSPGESIEGVELTLDARGRIEGELHASLGDVAHREILVRLEGRLWPTVTTDAAGRFTLESIEPGRVELYLSGKQWIQGTVEVRSGETRRVVLGAPDEVEVSGPRYVEVSGRVTRGGEPFETNLSFRGPSQVNVDARTNADGDYRTTLAGPGAYEVSISSAVYRRTVREGSNELSFDVPSGELLVRVQPARGSPAAYTIIHLERLSPGPTDGPELEDGAGTGLTFFVGLAPGRYVVRAEPLEIGGGTLPRYAWFAEEIEITDGEHQLVIELARAASVGGLVFDADGYPVRGAELHVTSLDGLSLTREPAGTTLAGGRFTLDRVPPGTWVLVAERGDRRATSDPITVYADDSVEVQLAFDR